MLVVQVGDIFVGFDFGDLHNLTVAVVIGKFSIGILDKRVFFNK